MARHWEDREKIRASLGKNGWWGHILWFLAVIFAILGVIADAVNATLGLEPISWFLLAIATFVVSAIWYLSWAVAVYLRTIEAKKKE